MNKKMIQIIILLAILLVVFGFFFIGFAPKPKTIQWGMNFSQRFAEQLGLDWREVYLAMLDDMQVKEMKIAAHWNKIEMEDGKFDFSDIDFQMDELAKRQGKAILVFGMKTTRWPECHIPNWAKELDKAKQQEKIGRLLKENVNRYKYHPALAYWQPENEALFRFGECPWIDEDFYRKELAMVKELDAIHPVIMSDSGEGSLWFKAAHYSDLPSVTLYRQAWFDGLKSNINYPFPPVFYYRKALLVKWLFAKEVILGESQAEPWCPRLLFETPWEEQMVAMNFRQFKANIDFAKKTGFNKVYLWGGEWMYWAKIKQNHPEFWDLAKQLFVTP